MLFRSWLGEYLIAIFGHEQQTESRQAWNIKPSKNLVGRRKALSPSAEFVESFLIFFYGSTNVFLEHLAAWGSAWSPQDLEHISITIMFFGGGLVREKLCIESGQPLTISSAECSSSQEKSETCSILRSLNLHLVEPLAHMRPKTSRNNGKPPNHMGSP